MKTKADTDAAAFADVSAAVGAALEVQRQLATANVFLPADWDLEASIGIGLGEVLMIEDHDFYGNELTLASKLGEDVAGPGETLLTEPAHERLISESGVSAVVAERREIPVSKMMVVAYQL